jgi:hypothetical protein
MIRGISGGQGAPERPSHAQPVHREHLFHPFFQAACCARIHTFQLPEEFLHLGLRLGVICHRIGVAEAPVVVLLGVLGQMILHVPPVLNLEALHLSALAEDLLDSGPQRLRAIKDEFRVVSPAHDVFPHGAFCRRPSRCSRA